MTVIRCQLQHHNTCFEDDDEKLCSSHAWPIRLKFCPKGIRNNNSKLQFCFRMSHVSIVFVSIPHSPIPETADFLVFASLHWLERDPVESAERQIRQLFFPQHPIFRSCFPSTPSSDGLSPAPYRQLFFPQHPILSHHQLVFPQHPIVSCSFPSTLSSAVLSPAPHRQLFFPQHPIVSCQCQLSPAPHHVSPSAGLSPAPHHVSPSAGLSPAPHRQLVFPQHPIMSHHQLVFPQHPIMSHHQLVFP